MFSIEREEAKSSGPTLGVEPYENPSSGVLRRACAAWRGVGRGVSTTPSSRMHRNIIPVYGLIFWQRTTVTQPQFKYNDFYLITF